MSAPSPGWYPDPDGAANLRWWDGAAWTDFVTELPQRAAVATVEKPDPAPAEELRPVPDPEPEPAPLAPAPAPVIPLPQPAPDDLPPAARRRWPLVIAGVVALVVVAFLVLGGSDSKQTSPGGAALVADTACLRLWNDTDSPDAADLRARAAAFRHGFGRLVRVKPLPGTLMEPRACALELYQPDTDDHMTIVAGVQGQLGYLDVTTYPRAATYGWPTSRAQANVRIDAAGRLHLRAR